MANYMEDAVDKYSSNIAITCMGADVTYAQYNNYANSFAAYLQNNSELSVGDRIAIMVPNVIQFAAFFCAQKAGFKVNNSYIWPESYTIN